MKLIFRYFGLQIGPLAVMWKDVFQYGEPLVFFVYFGDRTLIKKKLGHNLTFYGNELPPKPEWLLKQK